MRVTVDIRHDGDKLFLDVTVPGLAEACVQEVTWLSGTRLLVAEHAKNDVADPAGLVRAVEHCDADSDGAVHVEHLKHYGRLLFDAAFGDATWQRILRAATGQRAEYLEVAVGGLADSDHVALQALRWEALYDGKRFIAAQGTTDEAFPVGVVRLIGGSPGTSENAASGNGAFQRIEHIPRVLFAVGSHLGDQSIRPGAEFMGIMRRLDRNGGWVQARVLDRATRTSLLTELETFKPDVLHLIGHGRWVKGEVKVQLRPDSADEDGWVAAKGLLNIFAQAGHRPTMVLLSACHTADSGDRGSDDPPMSALPFAARLVAGDGVDVGVPVVVAMAGDISDTACRVFTQALTTAIGKGEPLGKAVIRGRRAAFYGGPGAAAQHSDPESGHWVMPALFLAAGMPDNACLVNTARTVAAQRRVLMLGMTVEPVFCGRAAFMSALDRLLDADDALNVLVAHAPGPGFGGRRLLKELGARAVRSDVLPVLLGPFPSEAFSPKDLPGLATRFQECLDNMRTSVPGFREKRPRPTSVLAVAREGGSHPEVAAAIREDLKALVADLRDDDPVRHRPEGQPRTILLCYRVDGWGAFNDLAGLLGPNGVKGGEIPVPVVFTAADGTRLREPREHDWWGETWIDILPLGRLARHIDEAGELVDEAVRDEDILAYQHWLLNPERRGERVYALSRSARSDWPGIMRLWLEEAPIYPRDKLLPLAKAMSSYFTHANDDELLSRFASVLT